VTVLSETFLRQAKELGRTRRQTGKGTEGATHLEFVSKSKKEDCDSLPWTIEVKTLIHIAVAHKLPVRRNAKARDARRQIALLRPRRKSPSCRMRKKTIPAVAAGLWKRVKQHFRFPLFHNPSFHPN